MKLTDILKGSEYSLTLFKQENITNLENRITTKANKKGGEDAFVTCIVRDKEIKLTSEEIVRQLYTEELIEKYGYPKERLVFEYPIYFGREAKRADIVVRDRDDFNVAYIIVEVKKPKAKDGSVGIAYKLEQNLDAITSGAILHLRITDKEFLPDYLTLVLNSIIVKMQAARLSSTGNRQR